MRIMRVLRNLFFIALVLGAALWILEFKFDSSGALYKVISGHEVLANDNSPQTLKKLKYLTRSTGLIQANYVVPDRLKPLPMLLGALRGAEGLIPDMMIIPDADEPEDVKLIEVRMGVKTKSFAVEDVDTLFKVNWRLKDIFEFVADNLSNDVKTDEVEYAAINGMLLPLDEHSSFLSPRAYADMMMDTEGRFGGLGIVISSRNGVVTIVSVMEETPAEKAGLRSGDQIVEIGDESAMNMSLTTAVSKMRGEPGTEVTITIERKGWDEPRQMTLVREEIRVKSVTHQNLKDGIGYIKVRNFQEDTVEQVENAIKLLGREGANRGFVLDLRQNSGGLLAQAVELSNLFIPQGTLVITEGDGKKMHQEYEADGSAAQKKTPVVVLIDGGSASAAEIVAGALKNNDRAVVIGNTSFGKGTVQVLYDIEDAALKLTVAQYLIPGKFSIQGVGVVPDVETMPVTVGKRFITMGLLDDRRPRDRKRRLEPFGEVSDVPPAHRFFWLDSDAIEYDDDDDELPPLEDTDKFKQDEVITLGKAIVGAIKGPYGRSKLEQANEAIAKWNKVQDARISQLFAERGVNWSAGPAPSDTNVRVDWSVEPAGPLVGGTEVKLKATAVNLGAQPLHRVHCMTESENGLLDGREFVFGLLEPSIPVEREIDLKIPLDSYNRLDQLRFRLFQQETELPSPSPVAVEVAGVQRPRFAFTVQIQDSGGDGLLNDGEAADVLVDVFNLGPGPASKVLVTIRNSNDSPINIRTGRVKFDQPIPPGGHAQATFKIDVRKVLGVVPAELEVLVLDLKYTEFMSEKVKFELYQTAIPGQILDSQHWSITTDGAKVLAAADTSAFTLFNLPSGFVLKAIKDLGDFVAVKIGPKRFGFVAKGDGQFVGGETRLSTLPTIVQPSHVQPELDVSFEPIYGATGERPMLKISGKAGFFGHDGEARRKVLVYRGMDKVHFWTRFGATTEAIIDLDTTVPLIEGQNDISVLAVEGKDRSIVRRFSIYVKPWSDSK